MVNYVFKEDGPLRIRNAKDFDVRIAGEALEKIAAANGGHLNVRPAVKAARDPAHPLHQHLEWDDAVAAEAHREDQMRSIIRCVRIVDEDGDDDAAPVRAFLSIADRGGVSYRRLEDVKRSADLQAIVLRQARRDLHAFQQRYRELQDVCDVLRDAEELLARRQMQMEEARVGV